MREAEEIELRYAARFPGWRRSRAPECPRPVAGKRCLSGYPHRPCCPACQSEETRSLFDHQRAWIDDMGRRVLTLEPYHVDPAARSALKAICDDLSLVIEASVDSPWFPGRTKLLIIRTKK